MSKKYSSDDKMQKLFEGFRRSLNEERYGTGRTATDMNGGTWTHQKDLSGGYEVWNSPEGKPYKLMAGTTFQMDIDSIAGMADAEAAAAADAAAGKAASAAISAAVGKADAEKLENSRSQIQQAILAGELMKGDGFDMFDLGGDQELDARSVIFNLTQPGKANNPFAGDKEGILSALKAQRKNYPKSRKEFDDAIKNLSSTMLKNMNI